MTADEPVLGVPRLCARRADCTRPRGHDDDCGPDRADTELADLRAEVERLRLYAAKMSANAEHWSYVAEMFEAERDAALARLVEAEGVARTNAAWVQQQHAAAKEAREQRDALQRQVDAVMPFVVRARRWIGNCVAPEKVAPGAKQAMLDALAAFAAPDAAEPADQPHPTPEADDEVEAFITEATRPPRQHGARS